MIHSEGASEELAVDLRFGLLAGISVVDGSVEGDL